MIWLYINYPNPHLTIHKDPSCPLIRLHHVPNQRVFSVEKTSIGPFLEILIGEKLNFTAQQGLNDAWISIGLDAPAQELGLVHIVQVLLGKRYTPLASTLIAEHC